MRTLALIAALAAAAAARAVVLVGPDEQGDAVESAPAACPAAEAVVRTVRAAAAVGAAVAPAVLVREGKTAETAVSRTGTLAGAFAAPEAKPGACRIGEARQAASAESHERAFGEVRPDSRLVARRPAVLADARPSDASAPGAVKALSPAKPGPGCDIVATFARKRFLSGPWSVSRRLEAARIRGDADEIRRMEAMLDRSVERALVAGGGER